jgi:hypothetical protein
MTVRALPAEDEPIADDMPVDDVPAPLLGFHWEFSDAESERFAEAILSAIASDDLASPDQV